MNTEAPYYTEGGKGRKPCPSCNGFVGNRTAICPKCQHVFDSKKTAHNGTDVGAPPPVKYFRRGYDYNITTPCGACPHRLTATDEETVRTWCGRVQNHFEGERRFLTMEGMTYFVRQFYTMGTPEFREAEQHIASYYANQAAYSSSSYDEDE